MMYVNMLSDSPSLSDSLSYPENWVWFTRLVCRGFEESRIPARLCSSCKYSGYVSGGSPPSIRNVSSLCACVEAVVAEADVGAAARVPVAVAGEVVVAAVGAAAEEELGWLVCNKV